MNQRYEPIDGILLGQLMVQLHLSNAAVCNCEHYTPEGDRLPTDLVDRRYYLYDHELELLKLRLEKDPLHLDAIPDPTWKIAWNEYCDYFGTEAKYPTCFICAEHENIDDRFTHGKHHICSRCFSRLAYLGDIEMVVGNGPIQVGVITAYDGIVDGALLAERKQRANNTLVHAC